MMAGDGITLAAALRVGAFDDIDARAVGVEEIEVHGREVGQVQPRLRTALTAFRNTSGSTTAEPTFK